MQVTGLDLGHRFGAGPWLFRHLELVLRPGETTAVVGPSGSGKSTLLALVAGQLEPTEGRVERDGITRTGWVPQHPFGVRHRSALDHVTLPLLARGLSRPAARERAEAVMEMLGLAHLADSPFMRLSGGEAQRLGLARAVAAEHDLLLVDEPTAQLDADSARIVIGVIGSLARTGGIVLVSTHDPRLAGATTRVIGLLDPASTGGHP